MRWGGFQIILVLKYENTKDLERARGRFSRQRIYRKIYINSENIQNKQR